MHYTDEITTDTKYLLTHNEMFSVKKMHNEYHLQILQNKNTKIAHFK